MTEISVGALGFLLSLADFQDSATTADMLMERTDAESEKLVAAGLFSPGPNRTMIDVELSNGDGAALVEDDPVTGGFRYLHPEDGYIPLSPERLRTWRLNPPKLATLIAQLLGMPASFRPTPLVEGLLWDLGTPRLGRRKGIPVLFGVRLGESDVRTQVRRELELRQGAPLALVMTSGQSIASDITLPTVLNIVPVLDVLDKGASVTKTSPVVLNLARLAALANPRHAHADAIGGTVQCSPDGAWLRIGDQEYTFSRKQRTVIRLLYEAWERREEWVGEDWVLAEAEYDSKRLQDAFKTHPHWREVIEAKAGRCRLRVPEDS